jgi:hypothetical protein
MRNITVTIDDDSYTRARVWAAQRDTSVSAGVPRAVKAFPLANSNRINAKPAPLPPTHRTTRSFSR